MISLLIEHTLSKPTTTHKQRLDYKNANWKDMNHFLSQYDFTLALNSDNIEFIWFYLKTAVNSAINLYVSLLKKQINQDSLIQQFATKLNVCAP